MLYTHPNKIRSLENTFQSSQNHSKTIIIFGPPSSGKFNAITHCLKSHKFATFQDSIRDSRERFSNFLSENADRIRFINGCPFFGLNDRFRMVLEDIDKAQSKNMTILKLTVEAETSDVIWKYKNYSFYKNLVQIQCVHLYLIDFLKWVINHLFFRNFCEGPGLRFHPELSFRY